MYSNEKISCKYCSGVCIKNGVQRTCKQRFVCKSCRKRQQKDYLYKAYNDINSYIIAYTKEGIGIRSTSRLLHISATTLMKRIKDIARAITVPDIVENSVFEVDEIKSFVGRKKSHIWIAYALNRKDNSVSCFSVGPRTNKTLNSVICKLSKAKAIYTDRLNVYKSLINKAIHKTSLYGTNHIERNNLTIRTHIKRLTRRTICFSRNINMLGAILKIYFWAE